MSRCPTCFCDIRVTPICPKMYISHATLPQSSLLPPLGVVVAAPPVVTQPPMSYAAMVRQQQQQVAPQPAPSPDLLTMERFYQLNIKPTGMMQVWIRKAQERCHSCV